MIRKYIIEADDSIKGFDGEIAKLEREWGAEEIEPSEDCISREAVITKIEDEDRLSFMGVFCSHDSAMGFREEIKELPSVTPQQTSWIPCSERLPEENGNYLVTVETNDGTASIKFQMVDHYGPKWLHEGKHEKVIAWMPLPDPYQSDESVERG